MEYLEGNTSGVLNLKEEKDKLIVILPNISNEPKRVNYKIECYISKNYNIPIIIDSVIIPIDYSFQVWDFLTKNFKDEKLEILLPIVSYNKNENYFTKYNDEWLEINLNFIIKVPWKNRKTKAIIRSKASKYNNKYINFEKEKEIYIDDEIKNIEYKLYINCENITNQEIGYCECEIEGGQPKRIYITKKDCECMIDKINFNKIELFELQKGNNGLNEIKIGSYDKITNKINNRKGIYICPFGFWNYNIIKINNKELQKDFKYLDISNEGKVSKIEEKTVLKKIF